MELKTNWQLSQQHFGPLWKYVENDDITDIDFNGTDLWISNIYNERLKIDHHEITAKFVENFSHYIANNVSKPFNKMDNLLEADYAWRRLQRGPFKRTNSYRIFGKL